MLKVKVTDDGKLVDESGNPVTVNGEPVEVEGVFTQSKVESMIQDRVKNKVAEVDELKKRINALEKQPDKSAELQALLDDMRNQKTKLEAQLNESTQAARAEVQAQLEKATSEAAKLKDELATERAARLREQVSNSILGASQDLFIDPQADIVPKLLAVHKREKAKDSAGNVIDGQEVDLFRVLHKGSDGKTVEEWLTVDKAVKALSEDERYRHYVRPDGVGGSGGGRYTVNGDKNPWAKETFNVTEQHQILATDPEKAKALKRAAGIR